MSWQQLIEIRREARELAQQLAQDAPVACPFDGTPLEDGPESSPAMLHCRFCGYIWQG